MAKKVKDIDVLKEHLRRLGSNSFKRPTNDDLAPCYDVNLMKVSSFYQIYQNVEYITIVASGADDCMYIRHCQTLEEQERIFLNLYNSSFVSIKQLLDLGFIHD